MSDQPIPMLEPGHFTTENVQNMDDVISGLNLILDAFLQYLSSIETIGTNNYFVYRVIPQTDPVEGDPPVDTEEPPSE